MLLRKRNQFLFDLNFNVWWKTNAELSRKFCMFNSPSYPWVGVCVKYFAWISRLKLHTSQRSVFCVYIDGSILVMQVEKLVGNRCEIRVTFFCWVQRFSVLMLQAAKMQASTTHTHIYRRLNMSKSSRVPKSLLICKIIWHVRRKSCYLSHSLSITFGVLLGQQYFRQLFRPNILPIFT